MPRAHSLTCTHHACMRARAQAFLHKYRALLLPRLRCSECVHGDFAVKCSHLQW
jgi:hypothetical protein